MRLNRMARNAVRKPLQAVGVLKSDKRIVQEIHTAFETAPERIAEQCRKAEVVDNLDAPLKGDRLKKVGFVRSHTIQKENRMIMSGQVASRNNADKMKTLEALEYFQHKYPQYKFITENEIKVICHKYKLIYGSIDRFTGEVPEKNLQDVENFSINPEDECWVRTQNSIVGVYDIRMDGNKAREENAARRETMFMSGTRTIREGLEIAAPMDDFNLEGMELHGLRLVQQPAKDPVVLSPVFHKGTKYYLVVTVWGPEASDELIVNQKMN